MFLVVWALLIQTQLAPISGSFSMYRLWTKAIGLRYEILLQDGNEINNCGIVLPREAVLPYCGDNKVLSYY